jgi:hypothetical protein
MEVGQPGRHSSAGGAIQKALLDEKRFIDIFYGITFFANGGCKGVQPYRAPAELVDYREKDQPIRVIQPYLVDLQHLQGILNHFQGNDPISLDLSKITNPAEQPVGNPRSATATAGKFLRTIRIDPDI